MLENEIATRRLNRFNKTLPASLDLERETIRINDSVTKNEWRDVLVVGQSD